MRGKLFAAVLLVVHSLHGVNGQNFSTPSRRNSSSDFVDHCLTTEIKAYTRVINHVWNINGAYVDHHRTQISKAVRADIASIQFFEEGMKGNYWNVTLFVKKSNGIKVGIAIESSPSSSSLRSLNDVKFQATMGTRNLTHQLPMQSLYYQQTPKTWSGASYTGVSIKDLESLKGNLTILLELKPRFLEIRNAESTLKDCDEYPTLDAITKPMLFRNGIMRIAYTFTDDD